MIRVSLKETGKQLMLHVSNLALALQDCGEVLNMGSAVDS